MTPRSKESEGAGAGESPLHVLAPGEFGGAERVVESLVRGQRDRGQDARVAAIVEPDGPGEEFCQLMEEHSVPLFRVSAPHRSYLREGRELAAVYEEHRPDVVHTHGYHADVVGGLAAVAGGRPRVSTVHGFTGGGWKNRLYEYLQTRTLRRFDRVVAVSNSVAERLRSRGMSPDRIAVVRNAWRPREEPWSRERAREELGLPPDEFVIGWVGRLSREKGPDVALRAVGRLEQPALLSMVGAGPEREGLRREAGRLGIGDRVDFHGLVSAAHRLFRAFDVLLLTSRTEGTPMVLLEAVHAGVPVVSTRVGGVPELLDEREARLVPPEDPDAAASAIGDVRRSYGDARRRAERARERLRRDLTVEAWVDRYRSTYREAVDRGTGGTT